ncbi:unnamed protein product, partial [Laminaria digitata]
PFVVGECICCRSDCVAGLYHNFKQRNEKEDKGSLTKMEAGQSSPMGRYPSTIFQVRMPMHVLWV